MNEFQKNIVRGTILRRLNINTRQATQAQRRRIRAALDVVVEQVRQRAHKTAPVKVSEANRDWWAGWYNTVAATEGPRLFKRAYGPDWRELPTWASDEDIRECYRQIGAALRDEIASAAREARAKHGGKATMARGARIVAGRIGVTSGHVEDLVEGAECHER